MKKLWQNISNPPSFPSWMKNCALKTVGQFFFLNTRKKGGCSPLVPLWLNTPLEIEEKERKGKCGETQRVHRNTKYSGKMKSGREPLVANVKLTDKTRGGKWEASSQQVVHYSMIELEDKVMSLNQTPLHCKYLLLWRHLGLSNPLWDVHWEHCKVNQRITELAVFRFNLIN